MATTSGPTRMFPTHNDLPQDVRVGMTKLCNEQLADTTDLYTQVKQSHWNVKGRDFYQLHELFDEQAARLLELADLIAERATALGGKAQGTARMAVATSRLPELPDDIDEGMAYVQALVERYGLYAATSRAAIAQAEEAGDQDTADLFTEVSRVVDKDLWFLEAHCQA
ncbi:MAG TPA: DNA starvation/stationary phase protection protein Dps [Thermomicrobiales bacterium]|nr:DNA starvation/stationary phase protection protein Dps [Thermomicrobiales bacterium]